MDIRTFRAATLQEALEQVRETLGPDAAVLHTRQVKRSRMGLFSSSLIEVEASVEMPVASRLVKRPKVNASTQSTAQPETKATVSENAATALPAPSLQSKTGDSAQPSKTDNQSSDAPDERSAAHKPDHSEAESVAKRATTESSPSRLPPAMYETLSEMLDAGVEPAEAKALLQAATKMLEVEN